MPCSLLRNSIKYKNKGSGAVDQPTAAPDEHARKPLSETLTEAALRRQAEEIEVD